MIQRGEPTTPGTTLEPPPPQPRRVREGRGNVCGSVAEFRTRRILVVAPQPFYEDRGTPIAVRQVLEALSELGRPVDLLTFPIGSDVAIRGLRIFRSANPFGFRRVPIGLSVRKVILDLPLTCALYRRVSRERYQCIHAVEEAAFPAAVLARRHGISLLYDMQSSLAEQLARLDPFGLPLTRRALNALEDWLLRRTSLVVTSAGLAARVNGRVPEDRKSTRLNPVTIISRMPSSA